MAVNIARGALIGGLGLILGAAVLPTAALAGGSSGGSPGCGCHTPTPPPPPPPPTPPCCAPAPPPNINVPGVNVNVAASVIVNTQVNAQSTAVAASGSQTFIGGGGGGGGLIAPTATGYIQGIGGGGSSSYEATRTLYKKVVIQAFCFDDKLTPHPASQVSPDRDVEDSFEGELYRCIAGTHMQVTIADWKEHASFEGGQTLTCQKGEALFHSPGPRGGTLQCRPQRPARDCNERSLLRRFGAGIKVLTMLITEKYTAYRQESTTGSSVGMSLDGGVGGIAY